ncbi:Tetratricopeptide TPR_1 repeat-containing protein [Caldithrix abyssi DSM 13497]|uniref:Tetratricopeptide TPR_1 repeat-containing protein n=1 Tax=Caldithrix abyssi DSM 13497 TaxID=880073 RepID=H1XXF6_CALAY|nr:tetratricopeptide repeat protein [Caldithrix abyssi]APF17877.1 hypothetical protein Cabys_1128 [Caldithrix abyssi DSM 13497]EHO41941.1 Tetratricopeptide TPR_1 repeat-containing protein [Caldithrix abyssi DSM 13497]
MQSLKKVLIFTLLILFPLQLLAQLSDYDILVRDARDLISNYYWKEAEEALRKAIKIDSKRTEAYLELGKLLMMQRRWHDAKPYLNMVIKANPNHIEAHYQMAIADRQDAIGRDQIWKRIMWKNSKKHFLKVIELDSTYKEVFNEFAHLKLQQEEYEDAVNLCLRQLKIKPQASKARYDIFQFYDSFLYHGGETAVIQLRNKDAYQIKWLKSRNGPYDQYFLGEKYRRLGQFEKADSIFHALLKRLLPFPKVPIYLSLVRLYYQTDQPEKAEKTYWTAVNQLKHFWEMRFIFDDIKYIMTDHDLQQRFKSLQAVKDFYHRFWNKHNPLGSLPYNPRLAEHYKRLIKAEKDFVYDRIRLEINNPDRLNVLRLPQVVLRNTKFNDKGLVYIRYGEPDDRAVSLSDGMTSNESWLYYPTVYNPKLIFHFEIAEHAPPGDWRLIPVPSDRNMLESRLGWDPTLDRYLFANNELEARSALHELRIQAENTIAAAMERERPTWSDTLKPITINLMSARFRSVNLKNDYLVWLSIDLNSIDNLKSPDDTVTLETGLAIFDSTWNQRSRFLKNIPVFMGDTVHIFDQRYIVPYAFESELSKLYLATHVRNPKGNQLGGFRFALDAQPFDPEKLDMSDLVLGLKIEPSTEKSPFVFHNMFIEPNIGYKFKRNQLVYLYFELYNLTLKNGQTEYEIEQAVRPLKSRNLFTNLKRLFGIGTKEILITRTQVGASPTATEYSAFDFSALPAGKKELVITVKDLNSGEKVSNKIELELVD